MSIADVTDVADTVSAGRTARFARETFGAGGRLGQKLPLAPVMEVDEPTLDPVLRVNLRGLFAGCQAAALQMILAVRS